MNCTDQVKFMLSSKKSRAPNLHANSFPHSLPSPYFPLATRNFCSSVVTDESSGYAPQSLVNTVAPGPTAHHSMSAGAFLRPRRPFKLAAFNVRTLMRIGQQASLARTLETLATDVCCLSETRIQDSSALI